MMTEIKIEVSGQFLFSRTVRKHLKQIQTKGGKRGCTHMQNNVAKLLVLAQLVQVHEHLVEVGGVIKDEQFSGFHRFGLLVVRRADHQSRVHG